MPSIEIGFLAFPRLTQLDLTGPFEVLSRLPGVRIHVVARDLSPVAAQGGFVLLPSTTLGASPPLDVVCVPGGEGVDALLLDDPVLDWLAAQGARARYLTSVCTGALALGAAGLLRGYLATTHWLALDLLPILRRHPHLGAGGGGSNRVTGGGVTAGIDLGLTLAALLSGEEVARQIALGLEYAPSPPFPGSPRSAEPSLVNAMLHGAHDSGRSAAGSARARSRAERRDERRLFVRGGKAVPLRHPDARPLRELWQLERPLLHHRGPAAQWASVSSRPSGTPASLTRTGPSGRGASPRCATTSTRPSTPSRW